MNLGHQEPFFYAVNRQGILYPLPECGQRVHCCRRMRTHTLTSVTHVTSKLRLSSPSIRHAGAIG